MPHFLGFRDAYDHIEHFKQICQAYEPITEASKFMAFNLMYDNQARVWFRILNKDITTDFDYIIEDFLTNFSHGGNKWNPIYQLLSLK